MILGHQNQWRFLKKSAEIGYLSHAYLFCGSENLGKKTFALDFIKMLDCQNPDFTKRPCLECRSCIDIKKMAHPDVAVIQPEEKEIQISQIRDLQARMSLRPFSAPIKAAIIDGAHLMNQEAQSCFLKLLEEPKGSAIFILISDLPEMIFPTILSRAQIIKFFPLSQKEIEEYLKSGGASPESAKEIGSISFGRPGLAVDFMHDPGKLENQKKLIKEIEKLANSDLFVRFQYVKSLGEDSAELKNLLDIWLRYFRNVLLAKARGIEVGTSPFAIYSLKKLQNIIKTLQNTISLISSTNVSQKLALEVFMMEL